MSLMDWLRKLGVLRFGTKKAVYRSGTERPIEFMMPGVMNSEKDLIGKRAAEKGAEKSDGGGQGGA